MSRSRPTGVALAMAVAALVLARPMHAGTHPALTPEQACQKGRFVAKAKYDACEEKATASVLAGMIYWSQWGTAISKCSVKYSATWPKLEVKARGTGSPTCDQLRFTNGLYGNTVVDHLTGLEWERKTDDSSVHDKDNLYAWTAVDAGTAADGTVFTGFLSNLNTEPFAGQHDWRLPSRTEFQTILGQPSPCTPGPCIDEAMFGPTAANSCWSATTVGDSPRLVWIVNLFSGHVDRALKEKRPWVAVRAVRGGL